MHAFQYIIEISIGQEDITNKVVTQRLLLNRTMEVKYDSFNVQKGLDAKKYFVLNLE